jgi:hypothetical protein
MVELYRRLRPHPIWQDIEYSVRGDVRRFLRLQVGDRLNPQFIFSSGQRRATGLAFLLAINMSLAWSRWRTVLLDDPVQHVDDFRSVHLVEVLAQLCASGRQIICAVEDAALGNLLYRRLPISGQSNAKRVTLGTDTEGALAKVGESILPPLANHSHRKRVCRTEEGSMDDYQNRSYGQIPVGFGEKPGIVVVDFQTAFTDPQYPLGGAPLVMRAVENTAKLLDVARRYNIPVVSCNTAYMNEREMPYWKITTVRETFRHDHPSSALDPRIHDPGYDLTVCKRRPPSSSKPG